MSKWTGNKGEWAEPYVVLRVIGDKKLFCIFEQENPKEFINEIVYRSIKLKAEIVTIDPNDHGIRNNLNLGHTLGHAYEALSNYKLSHGFAVGIGLKELLKAQERNGDKNSKCGFTHTCYWRRYSPFRL